MTVSDYKIVELNGLRDPLLPAWLDLYETSFPVNERLLISHFLRLLQKKENGAAGHVSLSALVGADGSLAGMAAWQSIPELAIAYLWYIAICPAVRNQGLGARYYRAIVEAAFKNGADLVLFEVEIPEHAHEDDVRSNNQRRIAFYQRNGAALLTGIHYLQSVGEHVPKTPMHLMLQAKEAVMADEAYRLAKRLFGDALQQTGPLALNVYD